MVRRLLSSLLPVHTAISKHEMRQRGRMARDSRTEDIGRSGTHGGRLLVSAEPPMTCACSLLWPYLLEEVRTRVGLVDDEARAAGRPYSTPRSLLMPSAALVNGRAPILAPNSPGGGGGLTTHPFPGAFVSTFVQPDTGASVLAPEVAATKRPFALAPRGHCHPPARRRPLRSYGTAAGRGAGDFWHTLAI